MANVPMTVPPPPQVMGTGLEFLESTDGLFCQQKLELLEAFTGCETKNRYNITPVPRGMPNPTPPEWVKQFKEQSAATPLLKAKEESECMERICCPQFRSFTMPFKDGAGSTFLSLERPFKCTLFCQGCCMLNPQELFVKDAQGRIVAHAKEEFKCFWLCTRSFVAMDGADKPLYKIRVPECSSSQGCNVFAPSCCNENFVVDIYDPEETNVISSSQWVFPGCNCAGLTDMSNLLMRFPEGATLEQRAALIGGLMLAEFAVMEWKKANNNNNGGAMAGAM